MSVHQPIADRTARASSARELLTVSLLLGAALLLLLPLGLLWALAAWAVGAAMLWSSTAWTAGEKTLGTLVWPGGMIVPALLSTSVGQVCTQVLEGGPGVPGQPLGDPACSGFAMNPWVGLPLSVVVIGAPFVVAAVLLSRAGRA